MPRKPYSGHLDGLLETIPGTPQAERKAEALTSKRNHGLLPCPFCGTDAELNTATNDRAWWTLGCPNVLCHISPQAQSQDRDEMVAAWNKRSAHETTVAPAAWRYKDSRGHWRYTGNRPNSSYDNLLKPEPLYAASPLNGSVKP